MKSNRQTRLALAFICAALASCAAYHDNESTAGKPKHTTVLAFGGKGALIKTKPSGENTIFTWDNEKSFSDATKIPITQAAWGVGERVGGKLINKIPTQ